MFSRLWHEWYSSRFRMNPTIVFLLLFFVVHRSVFPHIVVDVFRNLSMIGDSSNLRMCSVFLFQSLGIVKGSSFTWSKLITNNECNLLQRSNDTTSKCVNLQRPIFPMLGPSTNECSFRRNRWKCIYCLGTSQRKLSVAFVSCGRFPLNVPCVPRKFELFCHNRRTRILCQSVNSQHLLPLKYDLCEFWQGTWGVVNQRCTNWNDFRSLATQVMANERSYRILTCSLR